MKWPENPKMTNGLVQHVAKHFLDYAGVDLSA